MKCKEVGDYHRHVYDKKPATQVDDLFVTQREKPMKDYPKGKMSSATILSAVDVITGRVNSYIVE